MSNQPGFFVQRESDNRLLNVFEELCKGNEQIIFQISFRLATNDSVTVNRNQAFEDFYSNPALQLLTEDETYLINKIIVQLKNSSITFIRGELLPVPSPIFDYIQSENTNNNVAAPQNATPEQKLEISKYLQGMLCSTSTPNLISSNLPSEYEALLSQHNSMLSRLEKLNTELLIKTQEKSQELESTYLEKLRELEEKYAERNSELNQQVDDKKASLDE